jgi:hypothetical protein
MSSHKQGMNNSESKTSVSGTSGKSSNCRNQHPTRHSITGLNHPLKRAEKQVYFIWHQAYNRLLRNNAGQNSLMYWVNNSGC